MTHTLITNPLLWADVPDVDPIRIGNIYYMVSTSMHSMPGCPIMRSEDLKHWEIVGYVFDTLEDNDGHNLQGGNNIYGQGSWAASLKHHNGIVYLCFSCNDTKAFYIYQTEDIERGPWTRTVIEGLRHDPALLFDEDRVFVFYGNGDIYLTELLPDLSGVKPDGIQQLLFETEREGIGLRCEGCHAYKLNGYYYLLFIEWPREGNRRRRQICYRSRELLGPYERKIVLDDDLGYHNKGVAQGGIFDTPSGDWYAMLFQDHDAVGRIPILVPMAWEADWPVFGYDGKVPAQFTVPLPEKPGQSLVISDEFNYLDECLALQWQWNHNPDHSSWSVTERSGHLRLRTADPALGVLQARNTLTQRTEGPACEVTVLLDTSGLQLGERAGLIALQSHFGTIGVRVDEDGRRFLSMCVNDGTGGDRELAATPLEGELVHLRIVFNFADSIDEATFHYSLDGSSWTVFGETLHMKYTLDHFMGYRIGLYTYATGQSGGHADFDYFRYRRLED